MTTQKEQEYSRIHEKMLDTFKNYFIFWTVKNLMRLDSLVSLTIIAFAVIFMARGHVRGGAIVLMGYEMLKLIFSFRFERLCDREHERLEKIGKKLNELDLE